MEKNNETTPAYSQTAAEGKTEEDKGRQQENNKTRRRKHDGV